MKWRQIFVRITGADIPAILRISTQQGIQVFNVIWENDLEITLQMTWTDFARMQKIVRKKGAELELLQTAGIYFRAVRLFRRPVLSLGMLLVLAMTLWIPSKILFVQVQGNSTLRTEEILCAAESCGISFGASRREVRSERTKNELTQALPQLQWVGVNTAGCVAVISVREGPDGDHKEERAVVSNVVASRDGIILTANATAGQLMCIPGQAVTQGQVLISGYQDLGLVLRSVRAQGEIYAKTVRRFTLVYPSSYYLDTGDSCVERRISLLVGKKRINLSKGSSIYATGCDKIYKEYYIVLPGGFVLPLGLAVERFERRTQETYSLPSCQGQILSASDRIVLESMIAGTITDRRFAILETEGFWQLTAAYLCTEMIGRDRPEELNYSYGENN